MTDKRYWIWLQYCLGVGVCTDEILAYFADPKEIYNCGNESRRIAGVFTVNQLKNLEKNKIEVADPILESCRRADCKIITPDDNDYPKMLKTIRNYPIVLYVLGHTDVLNSKMSISLVGTRRATPNGLSTAGKLAASLARTGVTVVSGGAYGIDGASHIGTLSEDGITIAVLGCGFLAKYKDSTTNIRDRIIKNGAVISEFPPETEARGRYFPIRNRIISALSYGTVVVEGAEGSGSLITARLALEQGRDVFAVPGDAINSKHSGTIKLIREGATPVFSCSDILNSYALSYPDIVEWDKVEYDLLYQNQKKLDFSEVTYSVRSIHSNDLPTEKVINEIMEQKEHDEEVKTEMIESLSENARKIYVIFGDEPVHVDDIASKSGLAMNKVLSALTELELMGIISALSGKKYSLNKK